MKLSSPLERVENVTCVVENQSVNVSLRIWEPENAHKSLLCIHGIAWTNSDFSPLAQYLSERGISVIAPDMFGRGDSTFFNDLSHYTLRSYLLAIAATEPYQKPNNCILGTSWGGLLALAYIATIRWRIKGVVLNDCPVEMNNDVRATYAFLCHEATRSFATQQEAADYLLTSRSMETLNSELQEKFLTRRLAQQHDGKWRLNYDPNMAVALRANSDFSVEEMLKRATRPVLMNFGKQSPYAHDPLNEEIANANPKIQLLRAMQAPHPPSLMKPDEIEAIADFLMACFD